MLGKRKTPSYFRHWKRPPDYDKYLNRLALKHGRITFIQGSLFRRQGERSIYRLSLR